ncbi:unnamed protein product [Parnassius apollo]|uniref:(apollo) hypothetical protein n=1 Tax=Parnassius apollo TaxID=110799 RepID=A0A8S3XFM6_PARAO|nr:unnamed protein product [Parnassius apollo]
MTRKKQLERPQFRKTKKEQLNSDTEEIQEKAEEWKNQSKQQVVRAQNAKGISYNQTAIGRSKILHIGNITIVTAISSIFVNTTS